jgi:hypothetical protein
MMQDLPRQFINKNVGFTSIINPTTTNNAMNIAFYNPVKNNIIDAYKKQKSGLNPACCSSSEFLMYSNICQTLQLLGVHVETPIEKCIGNIRITEYSRISLPPHLSLTVALLNETFPIPSSIHITQKSTFLVIGKGTITMTNTTIDGALILIVCNPYYLFIIHTGINSNLC